MGMRINGGGGYDYANMAAQNSQWQQRRQNFDALAQAISGGDLASAQSAYDKLSGSLSTNASGKQNDFLTKIGEALKAGDMSSAQTLLAQRRANEAAPADQTAAASATGAAATGGASGASGHRHHHHGGGGGESPALQLGQAIQSGDTATAQSSMQTIIDDLKQLSSLGGLTGGSSASGGGGMLQAASTAASNLLGNADFQSLEDAVQKGDASAMKDAWSKLISNASSSAASSAAQTSAATTQSV